MQKLGEAVEDVFAKHKQEAVGLGDTKTDKHSFLSFFEETRKGRKKSVSDKVGT